MTPANVGFGRLNYLTPLLPNLYFTGTTPVFSPASSTRWWGGSGSSGHLTGDPVNQGRDPVRAGVIRFHRPMI